MKKIGSCFLLFLILTFLTGCWDWKEVEEYSFVSVIGLDLPKGIDVNKEQAIDVTFQFANPKLNVKGAPLSESSEQKDIITLTAPDLVTAKNTVNSFVTLDNTQNIQDMYSSFADPLDKKYKIGVRLEKNEKTKVKVKLRKGRPPKIDVYYPVEIEILSIPSMINYGDNLENQRLLKRTITTKMKKNAENLIKKTQKEFKSDAFYWSLYVRPLFSTVKEYEEWDWTNKNYPYAAINVTMDVQIIGFGKQLRESEMRKVTD